MANRRHDRTAVVIGILFIVVGAYYQLEALELVVVDPAYIWPLLLIGLGIAVIFGGRRRRRWTGPEPIPATSTTPQVPTSEGKTDRPGEPERRSEP